jgi:hypothetical protein
MIAEPKIQPNIEAVKKSWVRAQRLAKLSQGTVLGAGRSTNARSFLKDHPQYNQVLDNNLDKRSPKTRSMVTHYANWCKLKSRPKLPITHITRPALGDPTQPARAGAPPITNEEPKPKLNLQILLDLQELQKKHQLTQQELAESIKILGILTDNT